MRGCWLARWELSMPRESLRSEHHRSARVRNLALSFVLEGVSYAQTGPANCAPRSIDKLRAFVCFHYCFVVQDLFRRH